MSIPAIPALSTGFSLDPSASIKRKDSPEKLRETASQFEALMIGQILKNAQEDNQGGVDGDQDDSAASTMDFANDFFSRSLAAKGGLGLAQVITNAVEHASSSNRATGGSSPVDTPPSG